MNTLQQKNLFRLSAVLYAKTNDKISTKQIYRKIIEDALFVREIVLPLYQHLFLI